MALLTAQDYLYQAFREVGMLRPGYSPSPELLQDGMDMWKIMFDEWNADRLMQYSQPDLQYTVSGPGSRSGGNGYTIGPSGADLTGPRPDSIIRMNTVLNPLTSTPVYVQLAPISLEQWAAQSVRQIPAINLSSLFYYDPQYPNGVINLYPPVSAGTVLEIFQFGSLTVPATLATAYAGPPMYGRAIISGLAKRLYYSVPKLVMPEKKPFRLVAGEAVRAEDRIKMLNRPLNRMGTDFPRQGQGVGFYDQNVRWTGEPY